MGVREACPACGSERFKRNGHIHTGQQNHQCKACGRQFVLEADKRVIDEEQRTLVERLLCEKIPSMAFAVPSALYFTRLWIRLFSALVRALEISRLSPVSVSPQRMK